MSPPANDHAFVRQGGFTLLEMVVVVTVLGLLIIGLTQGVRTGLTLWQAASTNGVLSEGWREEEP